MRRSLALSLATISASALFFGGCSLIRPNTVAPTPAPTPSSKADFPIEEDTQTTTLPKATPSATPKAATPSATTKGGIVKGTTTQSTKHEARSTSFYDTSFDSWSIINYPGQDYEKELILYNKSDEPVLYSVRANDRFSDTVPVSVNGSFEATGNMLPLSQATIKLKAVSNDKTPGFTTDITINFISSQNQILATKTVKVAAYTATGDRINVDTDTPTEKAGNQTADVTYRSLAAYPIRINNRNQRNLKFEAKIVSPEAAKVMAFSAKSGTIKSGNWWDSDVHFLTKDARVNQVAIEFTFFDEGNDTYRATKTLTLNLR